MLNIKGFGTKNLPDAIKWHCAYFWDHALTPLQISKLKKTKILLENSIAVPIWLKKSEKKYKTIGREILKVLND